MRLTSASTTLPPTDNSQSVKKTITVCRNGEAISNTLLFSVESYVDLVVAKMSSNPQKATLVHLVKEMLKYGDAAREL